MLYDDGAHDSVGDAEHTLKLEREIGRALEVDKNVVTLGEVVDRVSELASAPLVDRLDGTVCGDKTGELVDQSLYAVITLLYINDKQSFVGRNLIHCCYTSLWTLSPGIRLFFRERRGHAFCAAYTD